MQFSVYQESHTGGRKINQDRMGYGYTRDALLLVLADGLGGHVCGELAATLALQAVATLFQRQARPAVRQPERFMTLAFAAAHESIHRHCQAHGMPDTPRTTLVVCLIQHGTALWAHCGDSRLYWMRDGHLLERTRDHTHVEWLIERGLVAESARDSHPERNKLYNCVGAASVPQVALSAPASLLPGDVMLLCSDGLWSVLPEEELLHRLHGQAVERAVPDLLRAALAAAGPSSDNVTALAITWQGGLEHGAPAPESGANEQPSPRLN